MLKTSVLAAITFVLSIISSAALVYSSSDTTGDITVQSTNTTPKPSEIFKAVFASNTQNVR
jgi:uncharacterized protein (DUF2141 family)